VVFNPKEWLNHAVTLKRILDMETDHRKLIEAQADEIQELKDRLTKLEAHVQAREEIMVAEAKGTAAAVASTVVSPIARDLGRLEARLDGLGLRLPSPGN
jgi:hypothetical protein